MHKLDKIELIKADVHSRKLSEEAEKVETRLRRLSRRFEDIDDKWSTFYHTHLRHAMKKAEEVDTAYGKLRDEFKQVEQFSEREKDGSEA